MNLYTLNYQENRSVDPDGENFWATTKYIFAKSEQEAFAEAIKITKIFDSLKCIAKDVDKAINYPLG